MTVMAPADENECRQMLYTAYSLDTPSRRAVSARSRTRRDDREGDAALPIGKGEMRREAGRRTRRIAMLAFGSMLHPALAAAEQIDATVANMRFVKPLDVDLCVALARTHECLVTIEENVVAGGAGSAVAEALAARGVAVPLLQLGLPDAFIDQGDPARQLAQCGLDAKGIVASIAERFGPLPGRGAAAVRQ